MFVAKFIEVKHDGEEVTHKKCFDVLDNARMWLLSAAASKDAFASNQTLLHFEDGFVEITDDNGYTRFSISLFSDAMHDYVPIL